MSKKIIDLTQLTTPATSDVLPVVDISAGTTKKITIQDIVNTPGAIDPGALSNDASWAWSPWTPTWTNLTVGTGTVTARYTQIGKTVFFQARIVFSGSTVISGGVRLSLPVTSVSYGTNFATTLGKATFWDDSAATVYYGVAGWTSTTTIEAVVTRSDTINLSSAATAAGNPFTWAVNDVLSVEGTYEAA